MYVLNIRNIYEKKKFIHLSFNVVKNVCILKQRQEFNFKIDFLRFHYSRLNCFFPCTIHISVQIKDNKLFSAMRYTSN